MNYSRTVKSINILKAILSPIIFLYFIGFVGCFHWKLIMQELHRVAKEEIKNDVWFTKKAVSMYLKTAFFTCMNLFFWVSSLCLYFR
jgi:hypothetical protein